MKVTFCANLKTKPEQFFLPSDSEGDKAIICHEFETLKRYLDIPAVKKKTENDTIELIRNKTKKRCSYKVIYSADGFKPYAINFNVGNVKDAVCGYNIFQQITYLLAYLNHKFPEKLFANVDFLNIAKLVYAPNDN